MFNLDAPPGFRGLDPNLLVKVYYRHLPHWRQEGATYFITFRLDDALPQEKVQELQSLKEKWEAAHPPPRSDKDWEDFSREITVKSERWLDEDTVVAGSTSRRFQRCFAMRWSSSKISAILRRALP